MHIYKQCPTMFYYNPCVTGYIFNHLGPYFRVYLEYLFNVQIRKQIRAVVL